MIICQAYIAGKYTDQNPEMVRFNIRAALKAGIQIIEAKGWNPIIPHASMSHDTDWAPAMDRCADVIRSLDPARDCIILLPGWGQSKGAIWEKAFAESLGISVLTLAEALA
jgi:hypothetical protein